MNLKSLSFFIFLQFLFFTIEAQVTTDTILSRYRQYLLKDLSIKDIDDYTAKQSNLTTKNKWADIDYSDTSPAYWQVRNHIERVKVLAMAWTSPKSKYYHQPVIWQTISRALDHWLEKRYKNSNWWVNEIGVPQDMRDILVLIGAELTPTQMKQALEVLAQHKVRGVGANLIWSADLAIHYGALVKNEAMIKESVDLISKEIKITAGDGIQPDYSYHQHGPRLQIYHYGSSFLQTNVRIAWEVRGTPWSFPQEKINILTDFILKGWQWMSRGINIVPGTIDRAASRKDQLHNADLRALIPCLCDRNPVYAAAFTSIADRQNGKGQPLIGFRFFPYSDFAAYHQKDFSFFVKTISARTLKSESINTENLKGKLLNNGDAYIIKNGNEYFNVMPVWNWNFLPGQTNINSSSDTIISNPFAGSVTNQTSGATAMKYTVSNNNQTVHANKFWACHDNLVVCLVSDLKASNKNDSVFTALNQSRWQTAVEVNKPGNVVSTTGINQLKNLRWIFHSGIGYILLKPSTVQVQLDVRTSSWSAINASASAEPVTEKVFMPLLYHNALSDTSGGYVLVACNSSKQVMQLANKPRWQILINNAQCQAVQFVDGVIMAAFYTSGSLQLEKKKLFTTDRPCLIQITRDYIFVSDPLHHAGNLNFKLNDKTYKVSLNSDGTTVSVKR
jgi:chondroitin AC lyase